MKKIILLVSVLFLVGLDQVSKIWIVSHIALNSVQAFLPGIFSLTYLRNYGAAFSILQNQQWLFTVITLVIVGGASYYLLRYAAGNKILSLGLLLIISGGIGNFSDRLRLGYVVDMIHLDFIDFAIFNLADAYLTIGVLLVCIAFWREERHHGTRD